MVSITNVSSGQASTYYQRDNYYTRADGQWQGAGAEALRLSGEIQKGDFENLINGRDPQGNQLIAGGGENHEHRAGVDLTFSAPKSVSIAAEILGDERIRDAHAAAVQKTLEYVEQHYAQARVTQDGQTERVNTGNMAIAKFDHYTSRELDPQLHTHAVVMNMTQREDGQWRALSNEELYSNKMHIGQIYRSELAASMKDLGYAIQTDSRGFFEVQGVDKQVLDEFSRRSEQIQAAVEELKKQYPDASESKLKEMACLDSREAKKDVNMDDVRQSWQERLENIGYSREQVQGGIRQSSEQTQTQGRTHGNEHDYVRAGSRIVTEQESVFSRKDVTDTALKLSVGNARIDDIERAFHRATVTGDVARLADDRYTTAEMLRTEQDIVSMVQDGRGAGNAILSPERVQAGIGAFEQARGLTLTAGQKNAVSHILTSQDRYIGIQGDAGTGKTTMLSTVRLQAAEAGYSVRGLGFTGKSAAEVEAQAGISSQTIDSFLAAGERQGERQLWIVDEASMLGSRQMHGLLERAEATNARVVFMGDTKQLQSVAAGKMFQKLQESGDLTTVRMSEIQRQKTEDYRGVIRDIADRKIDSAMEKLESTNKISEISDRAGRLDTIVKDYTSRDNHMNTIIVTARNADRNALNSAIRADLQRQGKIGQQEHVFTVRESKNLSPIEKIFSQSFEPGDRIIVNRAGIIGRSGAEGRVISVDQQNHKITVEAGGGAHQIDLKSEGQHLAVYREKQQSFSQGEKIVFLKNDKTLNVKNGQTGTLQSVDRDGRATVKMETGGMKAINIRTQYNYIDHGYAVTDYKSQGQTSRDVIYHADTSSGVNYNQAYVAVTRGKHSLKIYTNDKENFREQLKNEQQKTSTLDYEARKDSRAAHPLDRAAEAIERERRDIQREDRRESRGRARAERTGKTNEQDIKKYRKFAKKFTDRDRRDLQKAAKEKDIKKAAGIKSFIVSTKTTYDPKTKTEKYKTEKLSDAWKSRVKDEFKNAFGKIFDKKYHSTTRKYDVFIRHKDGRIERAKQVVKITNTRAKQDVEVTTLRANGSIHVATSHTSGNTTFSKSEFLKQPADAGRISGNSGKVSAENGKTGNAETVKQRTTETPETAKQGTTETAKHESRGGDKTEKSESGKSEKTRDDSRGMERSK